MGTGIWAEVVNTLVLVAEFAAFVGLLYVRAHAVERVNHKRYRRRLRRPIAF